MSKKKSAVIDALNTGNSGVDTTFGNEEVDDAKVEAISDQQRILSELLPSVQWFRDICDDEIEAVKDIRGYIHKLGDKPNYVDIQDEYRARELYIGFLQRICDDIENRVANAEHEANT